MGPHLAKSSVKSWAVFGFAALILMTSCAPSARTQFTPGTTTEAQLLQKMGPPARSSVPDLRPQAKILDYGTECTFQSEKKKIVAISCLPEGPEKTLQYWRHKWQGQKQRYTLLNQPAGPHGRRLYQLIAVRLKMTVIYDPVSDRVLEVVKYGSH